MMFNLKELVRPNILNLRPYSSARDEFDKASGIFLDANENPFGALNRYPDPYQKELKSNLSEYKKIAFENIFVGNGSDEVIDLAFRIFCNPGKDKALVFTPTYGMYEVAAAINDVEMVEVPLNNDFQIDINLVGKYLTKNDLKIIFICSPNNPTGNSIEAKAIEFILQKFKGIVIVDEAYIDFSPFDSWADSLQNYPNLIVCQTFSKAWGLAAARVGIAYSSEKIIKLFNDVKAPYNVSQLNQKAALNALLDYDQFERNRQVILEEKDSLVNALSKLKIVKEIFPSDANFLLVIFDDANKIYNYLIDKQVITRNRNKLVKNALRFSVGSPNENNQLIKALKDIEQ